jgi:hypothetical protein
MSEVKTYIGQTGTQAFDGFKGLRVNQRYTGVAQEENILVSPVGAPVGKGILVTTLEWQTWFKK